jgi:hypothetical protein
MIVLNIISRDSAITAIVICKRCDLNLVPRKCIIFGLLLKMNITMECDKKLQELLKNCSIIDQHSTGAPIV